MENRLRNRLRNRLGNKLCALLIIAFWALSVNNVSAQFEKIEIDPLQPDSVEKALIANEQIPIFPNGEKGLSNFFKNNLRYPKSAKENNIEGTVLVRFRVDVTGCISAVTLISELDPECDKEAIRVIRSMPRWLSPKSRVRPYSAYFTLPVVFRLTPDTDSEDQKDLEHDSCQPDKQNTKDKPFV